MCVYKGRWNGLRPSARILCGLFTCSRGMMLKKCQHLSGPSNVIEREIMCLDLSFLRTISNRSDLDLPQNGHCKCLMQGILKGDKLTKTCSEYLALAFNCIVFFGQEKSKFWA